MVPMVGVGVMEMEGGCEQVLAETSNHRQDQAEDVLNPAHG